MSQERTPNPDPKQCLAVASWIGAGISEEDAMRLLYPAEAERMYAPDRWPCGSPKETE